jgi:hypothetical protein
LKLYLGTAGKDGVDGNCRTSASKPIAPFFHFRRKLRRRGRSNLLKEWKPGHFADVKYTSMVRRLPTTSGFELATFAHWLLRSSSFPQFCLLAASLIKA